MSFFLSLSLIHTGSICLGEIDTVETAAFVAYIAGLSAAKAMGIEHLYVEGNNKFVVDMMRDEARAKAPHIRTLCSKAKELANGFHEFQISHIRRELNRRADDLAVEARIGEKTEYGRKSNNNIYVYWGK